jgi:DNA-binding IclR family transcriptional regulator
LTREASVIEGLGYETIVLYGELLMEAPGYSPDQRYIVPAVDLAVRVLLCLAETGTPRKSLTEICSQVGIHKSRAFSILHTLQTFHLVQRYGKKRGYSLGPGLITLSRKVIDDFNIPGLARPILEELATRVKGTAALGIIEGRNVYVVSKHEGSPNIELTLRVGHRFPLTHGSHGKAIAAFMKKDELDKLLNEGDLYFHGKPEMFDIKRLIRELEDCRRDGFALELGEIRQGLNTAASPVLGMGETPIGYIVIIGLFSEEATKRFGPLVAEAGRALSRKLGARIG